jgi:hypothetical protein
MHVTYYVHLVGIKEVIDFKILDFIHLIKTKETENRGFESYRHHICEYLPITSKAYLPYILIRVRVKFLALGFIYNKQENRNI